MKDTLPQAALVLVRKENLYLGVSRKKDPNDFGLPGGKVDPGETPAQAAERELFEETGRRVKGDLVPIFEMVESGERYVTVFLAEDVTEQEVALESQETGVVRWVSQEDLEGGRFGAFNRALFESL